jgi:DNA gyrase subunit A
MATRNGKIKRVALSRFSSVRPSGLIAITLDKDDVLGWVCLTSGDDEVIIVTKNGQALRYNESKVRSMGRPAAGVRAINMRPGDYLAGMDVVDPRSDLLVVMQNGYGKRTPVKEYPIKGRATMGVITLSKSKFDVTGPIGGPGN